MKIPIDVNPWVVLVVSYLMGSIPFAYLAGKAKGVDLRTVGSGNLGATNVLRTFGWQWGAPVFVADALKGAIPAGLFPWFIASDRTDVWAVVYGLAAIAGHAKPVFLMFQGGGKGVATSAGVFMALAPVATAVSLLAFGVTLGIWGFVSLGSVVAAAVLPLGVILSQGRQSLHVWPSVLITLFVCWTHRANIERLRRGAEPSVRKRKPEGAA